MGKEVLLSKFPFFGGSCDCFVRLAGCTHQLDIDLVVDFVGRKMSGVSAGRSRDREIFKTPDSLRSPYYG